jgi:hypothetical protein
MSDKNATRSLIVFVRNYTDLLEHHLRDIHGVMRETVDGVMQGIQEISNKTAEGKRKANEVLTTTYTNPDEEAKKAIDDAQDAVDQVMEQALAAAPAAKDGSTSDQEELKNKLRRSSGIFSKHMESLERLDDNISGLLLQMMGALSRDDVISQRIEHVMMGLNAMQASLTYILTDFETRCKQGEVDRYIADLKAFTLRTYTTEEEKRQFYRIFPGDEKKKAS